MSSRARTLLSAMVAVLVLLEATPSLPHPSKARTTPRGCEIAATQQPVTLVAVAAERGTTPLDALAFERTALGTFVLALVTPPPFHLAAAAVHRADARRRGSGAFMRALQQRARSPGDPEPL